MKAAGVLSFLIFASSGACSFDTAIDLDDPSEPSEPVDEAPETDEPEVPIDEPTTDPPEIEVPNDCLMIPLVGQVDYGESRAWTIDEASFEQNRSFEIPQQLSVLDGSAGFGCSFLHFYDDGDRTALCAYKGSQNSFELLGCRGGDDVRFSACGPGTDGGENVATDSLEASVVRLVVNGDPDGGSTVAQAEVFDCGAVGDIESDG